MLTPSELSAKAVDYGEAKACLNWEKQLVLGLLAGAYIAFASAGSTMAAFNLLARPDMYGLGKCLAGAIFPTGLMLVVLAGGELFTGNTLMGVALLEGRIRCGTLLRNWCVVYAANFLGAFFLAHLVSASGLFTGGNNMLGGVTIQMASAKVSLGFVPALYRGILCNWLVCLAVWLAWSAASMSGKILAIFFPIWLFITSGFEHCIANMYYIPAGIFAKADVSFVLASGLPPEALANVTWRNFLTANLVPVTLGNIIGGAVFVGMAYWAVYRNKDTGRTGAGLRLKSRKSDSA